MAEVIITTDIIAKNRLREKIFELVGEYSALEFSSKVFIPGETVIPHLARLLGLKSCRIWLMHH